MTDMFSENDARLKAQKRIVLLMIICFVIAFVFIGLPFFMTFMNQKKEYVKLESEALPILMTPTSDKDSQFYYITDVNNQIYIVNLSNETFKSITATLNMETGKLNSVYELKGVAVDIEEDIRQLAFSNSFKVFKNKELSSDNFSEYLGEFYIKENFVSNRVVSLYKTSVFAGLFFLVLAFGYLVPVLIKVNLIFIQQKVNKWYYDIDEIRSAVEITAIVVNDCILLKDIGVCFPITGIQSCVMKKIWMGAVRCTVTMKNGSFLKFQLPKINGLPHYEEYRKAILNRLSSYAIK